MLQQRCPRDIDRICKAMSIKVREDEYESDLRAGVAFPVDAGKVGRSNLPTGKLVPVDLFEPWMGEHVSCTMAQVSVSSRRVAFHQLDDEVGCVAIESGWEPYGCWPLHDPLIQLHMIWFRLVIWGKTGQHFIDEDPKSVPIDRLIVTLLTDDLEPDVKRGSEMQQRRLLTSGAR
jgi:hypothetical protein